MQPSAIVPDGLFRNPGGVRPSDRGGRGTGSGTELGRINQLLAGVSPLETPLLLQIKKFGYTITVIVLIVGAMTFA